MRFRTRLIYPLGNAKSMPCVFPLHPQPTMLSKIGKIKATTDEITFWTITGILPLDSSIDYET